MTTSEIIRIVLAAIAAGILFYRIWQSRNKDDIEKRRRMQAQKEARAKKQEARKEAIREAKEKAEAKRTMTSEILQRDLGALSQKSVTAAKQTIWYLEGGQPTNPTVLLLHGFAGHKEDWAEVGKQLVRRGFHVVVPDLPGFGQNRRYPEAPHDLTTQTKRVHAFAKTLGLSPFHLVGASLGGSIATVYAYSAASEIRSVALIEPLGVRSPQESELDQYLARDMNPLLIANVAAYDNLLSFLFVNPPPLTPDLKNVRAEAAAENRELYLKMWQEITTGERADLVDMLISQVEHNMLVIQGAQSRVVHPMTAELIARRAKNGRAVVVEGCGHFVAAEKPSEVAEHLLDFLGSVQGAQHHTPSPLPQAGP